MNELIQLEEELQSKPNKEEANVTNEGTYFSLDIFKW